MLKYSMQLLDKHTNFVFAQSKWVTNKDKLKEWCNKEFSYIPYNIYNFVIVSAKWKDKDNYEEISFEKFLNI